MLTHTLTYVRWLVDWTLAVAGALCLLWRWEDLEPQYDAKEKPGGAEAAPGQKQREAVS